MLRNYDIIIIGGGPAGLTAAIYARRAGKTVLLLESSVIGGQISLSPKVDNYPGMAGISGVDLADQLYSQAKNLGTEILLEAAVEIRNGTPKTVVTARHSYSGSALILATGMKHRTLGLSGEASLSGISYCAVCDGAFYRDKAVAVYGGGSSALQEALFLSAICRHVTLIHRRDTFRGDPILVHAMKSHENITPVMNTVIRSLDGKDGALTGLTLLDSVTNQTRAIAVSGLFVAIGYQPNTTLAQSLGLTDSQGFLTAGEACVTALAGVFAAGDCRIKQVRQLVTACADGAVAALAACQYTDR